MIFEDIIVILIYYLLLWNSYKISWKYFTISRTSLLLLYKLLQFSFLMRCENLYRKSKKKETYISYIHTLHFMHNIHYLCVYEGISCMIADGITMVLQVYLTVKLRSDISYNVLPKMPISIIHVQSNQSKAINIKICLILANLKDIYFEICKYQAYLAVGFGSDASYNVWPKMSISKLCFRVMILSIIIKHRFSITRVRLKITKTELTLSFQNGFLC